MGFVKLGVYFVLLVLVLIGGYWVYNNLLSNQIQELGLGGYNPDIQESLINVSSEVKQFYPNMRFTNSKISYYIHPICEKEKVSKMNWAFSMLSENTGVLDFFEEEEGDAQILVSCSPKVYEKEKNIFIAGEGGPTQIVNSSWPVILKGKILLYNETRAFCEKPILELHELLHVFGYEHINKSDHIMYPYLDCDQEINPNLLEHLVDLYNVQGFSEIYFDEVKGYKERYYGSWYLNVNVSIVNKGIIDALDSRLEIYENEEKLEEFDLGIIEFGGGKKFFVQNLPIDNREKIELRLKTESYESNKENNNLFLEI